jgi:hypothetical protein
MPSITIIVERTRPGCTVHPKRAVNRIAAIAGQWRETTADAIYSFPSLPLIGTAGRPGRYTGTYGEFRGEWTVTPHYSVAIDAVRYAIAIPLREAGGHD